MKQYYEPKPALVKRMEILLKNKEDIKKFFEIAKTRGKKSIRVNTLKTSPGELIERLKNKGWKLNQPFSSYPEIIQIISELEPGELGKTQEHLLGYYYIQEITSMMPIIALKPKEDDTILDLCASPGSKTTQAAAKAGNKGTIIANDLNIRRISILSANLERLGVTNTIITRHEGLELCNKLSRINIKFNKILVDAPCSGEGNIRYSPRTYLEWSEGMLRRFGAKNKKLASASLELLKTNGEMIYSTCTHSPEENEEVIQHLIENYDIKIQEIKLPLKTRQGIDKWKDKKFHLDMKKAVRIYHHDNNMEGFFLCKIKKLSDKKKEEK